MSDKIRAEPGTIDEKGYGKISKKVMKDKSLPIEAKGIYAYLCSYAGAGMTAFPSVSLICEDLQISRKRYYKYMNTLKERDLVRIEARKGDKGKFDRNLYTIVSSPCSRFAYTGNAYGENGTTNNNSFKINSFNNNKKRYMDLPIHDYISLQIYNNYYKTHFGKDHPRVAKDMVYKVVSDIEGLYHEYDAEILEELIAHHFNNLSQDNDGKIQYFLAVKDRYLLEEEIVG